MRPIPLVLLLALVLAPAPAHAQLSDSTTALLRSRVEALLGLPRHADAVRQAGVADSTVRSVLDLLRQRKVDATEAQSTLIAERDAAREHGPTDNFGAFVQRQLDAGLRGQDLANAIRAEHAARGKGRPEHAGKPEKPEGADRDDGMNKGKGSENSAARRTRPDSGAQQGARRPN